MKMEKHVTVIKNGNDVLKVFANRKEACIYFQKSTSPVEMWDAIFIPDVQETDHELPPGKDKLKDGGFVEEK